MELTQGKNNVEHQELFDQALQNKDVEQC